MYGIRILVCYILSYLGLSIEISNSFFAYLNLGRYIHTITLLSTQKAMTVINYVDHCGIVVLEIVLPISYLSEYIHLILSSDYKICMVIRLHTMKTKMLLKNLSETLQIETFQAANLPPVTED